MLQVGFKAIYQLHTNTDDVELETALQQLLLDLLGDGIKADMAFWVDSVSGLRNHGHDCGILREAGNSVEMDD
jgi:hypothetical protein